MTVWDRIANHIRATTGEGFQPRPPASLGGGCINTSVRLSDGRRSYFVKLNAAGRLGMFEAEAAGLAELASTRTLRVPLPVCLGTGEGRAYLVLEYLDMSSGKRGAAADAGRLLARMHRATRDLFGWHRDNTIGATHQDNTLDPNWIRFWRDRRLAFQLRLAAQNGFGGRLQSQGERLLECFPALIDHAPVASLLHGDLWGGNLGFDRNGNPVVYDPAVYYGDREADLAMTELFGGFPADFYAAYDEAWPRDPGYRQRKTLYNLYHILNHLNLFGMGYLPQAEGMIDRLLAETRG
jgi:fructosamine-3-kinase